MNGSQASWIRAGSLRSLESNGSLVASVAGHTIAVFLHDRAISAVDNRCPHMGFPLNRGSVADGLLTCHWHHARFDLASGGTLDPFADNVRSYPVRLEGDDLLVDISSVDNSAAYWKRRLVEGLEDGLSLVIAKAVLALRAAGVSDAEIAALAGSYGLSYREGGWNTGMTILTALANVLPLLDEEDRPLALTHGLLRVAQDCAGQPPRFGVEPLPVRDLPLERLKSWFRRAVDVRDEDGSERVLQTVLASGPSLEAAFDMLYAAATDHLFIDGGHEIDFITKAGEYLGHTGTDQARAALGSLIHGLCNASRSEEAYSWRYPIDLTVLVERGISELRVLWPRRGENPLESIQAFAETLLGDDPASAINAVLRELERGTSPVALGQAVAYAAALRLARFPVSNEFGDWETVHNTWSSCHALYRALERVPSMELARGILHATMALYLDRFLNVPAAKLPDETSRRNGSEDDRALLSELTDIFSRQQQVHQAAAIVDAYLAAGHDDRQLLAAIGRLTLREDAGFHMYQTLEAGSRLYRSLQKREPLAARRTLVGIVRYLAAHAPTARSLNQTARIAVRLYRGEELFSETPEPAGVE